MISCVAFVIYVFSLFAGKEVLGELRETNYMNKGI